MGTIGAPDRRGAFAATIFTFAAFLAPAVLAPGPIELANLAGVILAVCMAIDVWRRFGRRDAPGSLAFRVSPAAPGLVAASALIFAISILLGWAAWTGAAPASLYELEAEARVWWDFPRSPIALYAAPSAAIPAPSPDAVRLVTLVLSAAVAIGALFCMLCFVAHIEDYDTLRRHALLWRGVKVDDGVARLEARGARGLTPLRDNSAEMARKPVTGRLYFRAALLAICVVSLAYAPFALRVVSANGAPEVQAFFASRLFENAFLPLWLASLWGACIAGALIHIGAYVRIGFLLADR